MIGTYAAAVAVCAASAAIGQAAIGLCGWRRWSWAAPAVGLALLGAICWATVRMPGHGTVSALVVPVLVVASVAYLWGRLEGGAEALRVGLPVALIALLAASLPFAAEGHFGILGTGFNPDMSQHLLAADRLAHGDGSQLLHQGYPLGPHAIVVALNKGLGIGLVQGFSGLTVAVAVFAPLTALAAFRELPAVPRTAAALVVGLAYVVASYFAQGAFKETIQALLFLAFVLALREATTTWRALPLRFVPAALLAAGSLYAYSFPSLLWLGPAALIWLIAEAILGSRSPRATGPAVRALGPSPGRALLLALLAFAVLAAPELGRMIDFHSFETFDPNGPGLGNLFGQVSPFEVLGVWPSGDFRLAPGDGAVPAVAYYLGIAFALALLLWGVVRCTRRREAAVLSGLAAAALAYAAARLGGTPYTAAKAVEIAAPIVSLAIVLPLAASAFTHRRVSRSATVPSPAGGAVGGPMSEEASATGGHGGSPAATGPAAERLVLAIYLAAAGLCSLLALANAPVGPTSYSPALTGLRPLLADASTLYLASPQLLAEEQGTPYLAWELRGGRVCIAAEGELDAPPPGVRFVVTRGGRGEPPFDRLRVRRAAPPYVLWESTAPVRGHSPCPLIAVRQARRGPAR